MRILSVLCSITDEVSNLYDNFKFGVAIAKIMECVQMVCVVLQQVPYCTRHLQGNAFLQRHQPWLLIKHPEEQQWLDTVLHTGLECVRLCCTLLYPVLPHSMMDARQRMGLDASITLKDLRCRLRQDNIVPGGDHIGGASCKLSSSSKPLFLKI